MTHHFVAAGGSAFLRRLAPETGRKKQHQPRARNKPLETAAEVVSTDVDVDNAERKPGADAGARAESCGSSFGHATSIVAGTEIKYEESVPGVGVLRRRSAGEQTTLKEHGTRNTLWSFCLKVWWELCSARAQLRTLTTEHAALQQEYVRIHQLYVTERQTTELLREAYDNLKEQCAGLHAAESKRRAHVALRMNAASPSTRLETSSDAARFPTAETIRAHWTALMTQTRMQLLLQLHQQDEDKQNGADGLGPAILFLSLLVQQCVMAVENDRERAIAGVLAYLFGSDDDQKEEAAELEAPANRGADLQQQHEKKKKKNMGAPTSGNSKDEDAAAALHVTAMMRLRRKRLVTDDAVQRVWQRAKAVLLDTVVLANPGASFLDVWERERELVRFIADVLQCLWDIVLSRPLLDVDYDSTATSTTAPPQSPCCVPPITIHFAAHIISLAEAPTDAVERRLWPVTLYPALVGESREKVLLPAGIQYFLEPPHQQQTAKCA